MDEKLDQAEFSKLTKDHLNSYIKLANQKASILLTAQLAFLGIFINGLRQPTLKEDQLLLVVTTLTAISAVIAAFYAARTIYPNTPETTQGLLLWDSIVEKGLDKYKEEIVSADEDAYIDELIEENYQLARVSKKKYQNLRFSIISTGMMVLFSLFVGSILLLR
ncbi:Pycsar system effector family protein [Halobacterium noricense]|uniref:Pycsar system effector family protein n=1 Tax=Halobacterium noricense TaxID=223182 RepID=UPI001E294ED5|nr:Pycsar system effector family protein [Halobacterium noricense]UHH25672.1 DUF5706 domain-containing protein [Halobacterium noricense]